MAKFFGGFFAGMLFLIFAGVILFLGTMWMGNRPPSVADGSTLFLRLEGDLPEQAPIEIDIPGFKQKQATTVLEVWTALHKAAIDKRIRAVVVETRGLTAGWAKLEELHESLLNFKKSGKPLYAYLHSPSSHDYYVATAASKIYMAPEDELDLKGLRAELMYLKGGLDKLGVSMEFEAVGRYKDAPDQLTKTGPTPETLEVTNQLLDQYYGDLVAVTAVGRNKTLEQVRAIIDRGPFVSTEAKAEGLVDELVYQDQFEAVLKTGQGDKLKRVADRDYARVAVSGWEGKTKVALVTGDGEITRSGSGAGDDGITSGGMTKILREVRDDDSIKGVVFRVDSPGGDSFASDAIWREAVLLSEKKPVVISMSDLAASGGYYIAMTGDPIVSYRNTLTGSIGVFYGKADLRGLYDKLGVRKEILTRGKNAAINTDFRPLEPAERAKLRQEIESTYRTFKDRVAKARKTTADKVEPVAQGRVWLGGQAKERGLVDEVGGLDKAFDLLKGRLKAESVSISVYPRRRGLIEYLLKDDSADVEASVLNTRLFDKVMGNVPYRALAAGGVLSVLPWSADVH